MANKNIEGCLSGVFIETHYPEQSKACGKRNSERTRALLNLSIVEKKMLDQTLEN